MSRIMIIALLVLIGHGIVTARGHTATVSSVGIGVSQVLITPDPADDTVSAVTVHARNGASLSAPSCLTNRSSGNLECYAESGETITVTIRSAEVSEILDVTIASQYGVTALVVPVRIAQHHTVWLPMVTR